MTCRDCGSALDQPRPDLCPACLESFARRRGQNGPYLGGGEARRRDRVGRLREALRHVLVLCRAGVPADEVRGVARAALGWRGTAY